MTINEQKKSVAIFGAGFGLYGYLPAFAALKGCNVFLPDRYREILLRRPELSSYTPYISWWRDEHEMLSSADILVCARRPEDNMKLIDLPVGREKEQIVIVEKPISTTPEQAWTVHKILTRNFRSYRVSYLFRYTTWAREIIESCKNYNSISISWEFLSYHYKNNLHNWKRYEQSGGGAVSFYGIHAIALLAEIGYIAVDNSYIDGENNEARSWSAVFTGPNLPPCQLYINSASSRKSFQVVGETKNSGLIYRYSASDPFSEEKMPVMRNRNGEPLDYRVSFLQALCKEVLCFSSSVPIWYPRVLSLWMDVHSISLYRHGTLLKQNAWKLGAHR